MNQQQKDFKAQFLSIAKTSTTISTLISFIADVLSPLGPILKILFYCSLILTLVFILLTFNAPLEQKFSRTKWMYTSIIFNLIFGAFFLFNQGTETGVLGDNIEVIKNLQGSLNLIDLKLNDISNTIQTVSNDIKDVKEIISGDAELKNMTSSEDLEITKDLNARSKNIEAKTIAILYFSNSGDEKKLDMLKKGLADMLISDLSNVDMLNIVERDKIETLFLEQKLNNSEDFDPQTASRIGKLLGAEIILTGAYFEMFGSLRLDARLIDVTSGEILKSDGVDGESSKFFKIQKQLSWKIIKNLDAKISEKEKIKLTEKESVEQISFDDAQIFSRALDYYDKNNFVEAIKITDEILRKYPDFSPALELIRKIKK